MPTITKQRPSGNRVAKPSGNGQGILDRIRTVDQSKVGRLKVAIYGPPKVGKTRLACTFPKPALIVGTEDGTASVVGTKGLSFVRLGRCEELQEIIDGPIKEGKFATVILDNGTGFRDMRIAEILGLEEVPVQKGWGFASRDNWMECSSSLKLMLRPLLDLPNRMELNVVVLAQEQDFTKEGNSANSDLVKPVIGSAVGESVCKFLHAECDYICHCFIREQRVMKKVVAVGGKAKEELRRTGRYEYCLRVGPHDVIQTGFRVPLGAPPLPDCIVDPDYSKIAKLIRGESL